ncbi:MAG: FecR family protein [Sphingobacterium hotanense]
MTEHDFKILIDKYLSGQCSDEEKRAVEFWYAVSEDEQEVDQATLNLHRQQIRKDLSKELQRKPKVFAFNNYWKVAAAAVLASAIAIAIYINQNPKTLPLSEVASIMPAKDQVELKLADGKTIVINPNTKQDITTSEGLSIRVDEQGNLLYQQEEINNSDAPIAYNTLTTPKGTISSILLADGSKVTLNAASSLRFPTRFQQDKREVYLEGEGYFEIKKTANHSSFIVNSKQQAVKVLGTKFVVKNYTGEAESRTTLVEGKVEVRALKANHSLILSPGQEATLNASGLIKREYDESSLAWINNDFIFINADLAEICVELERWYDVKFKIDNDIEKKRFTGAIAKNKSLQEILNIMSSSQNLNFRINAKTIYVSNF